jgi:hypothetical protein
VLTYYYKYSQLGTPPEGVKVGVLVGVLVGVGVIVPQQPNAVTLKLAQVFVGVVKLQIVPELPGGHTPPGAGIDDGVPVQPV